MAALTFFSFFSLGCGPGIMFYLAFIAHKSFISLVVLFSAFLFLSLMLLTSAIFIGFYPIAATGESYAGVIAATVLLEELLRYGVWRVHRLSIPYVERVAAETNNTFTLLDRMYLALGWGYGQGLCHSVFFFVSFLQLTADDGTYYLDTCPQMSFFLVGALYSLAFGALLPALMVIYFEGCHTVNYVHMAMPPLIHFGAAFLTLANMMEGGCLYVMPILLGTGLLCVVFAARLCWSKLMADDYLAAHRDPQTRPQTESLSSPVQDMGASDSNPVAEGTSRVTNHSISTTIQRNLSASAPRE